MKCEKCQEEFEDSKIHRHHIIPRYFKINWLYSSLPFNENESIHLCEKCHNIIHKLILIPIFDYIPVEWKPCSWQTKLNCCLNIRSFTMKWIKYKEERYGNTKTTES